MRIDLGEEEQPEIGLIALIDCIFFLLMFFMVATSFKQQDDQAKAKQLPIVLPTSAISLDAGQGAPEPLEIGLGKDGKFYLDGAAVSVGDLRDRLHLEAAANPGRPVRIDGDRRAAYQDVVHLLDLLQFEHLTNVSLHTRQ